MTPIPFADPIRKPEPVPEADARTPEDRPDPDAGPEAFLVAMGLVPGPAAPDAAGRDAGLGASPGGAEAADPPPAPSSAAQPAGTARGAGVGSAAAEAERPAPATTASPQEIAFLAAHPAADRATDPAADPATGPGSGGPGDGSAPAADPPSAEGDPGPGVDGQPRDEAEQATPLQRPARGRGIGPEASSTSAAPTGDDPVAPTPKDAPAGAPEAAAPTAGPAAKPGGRTGANTVGPDTAAIVDPLSLVPDPFADAAGGPDQTAARGADRPHPAPNLAQLPAGFGHRLAEAVAHFPDRAVELTLSPEELGRVRMTLSTQDGVLTLSIQADRPETIDLMRRHIDQLAQDFRDLGYTELSFSFGSGGTGSGDTAGGRRGAADAAPPVTDTIRGHPAPADRSGGDGGLDLRL